MQFTQMQATLRTNKLLQLLDYRQCLNELPAMPAFAGNEFRRVLPMIPASAEDEYRRGEIPTRVEK